MRNLISAGIRRFIGNEAQLRPGPLQAKVIAVTTSKGGVGKTTTAVHLAAGLALHHGWRVLLVDLDPQGHVGSSLAGVQQDQQEAAQGSSLAELLLEGRKRQLISLARPTTVNGLEVVPAGAGLADAESLMSTRIGKEFLLRQALSITRTHYHAIVLDCPPNLGNLTLNGLLAADGVVIPLDLSLLSLQGVGALLETLETVEERLGHPTTVYGILRTRVDRRNVKVNEQIDGALQEHFGQHLLQSTIGVSTDLGKAQLEGRPVYLFSPRGRASRDYRAFVDELLAIF